MIGASLARGAAEVGVAMGTGKILSEIQYLRRVTVTANRYYFHFVIAKFETLNFSAEIILFNIDSNCLGQEEPFCP